jgi:HPt (histidine-containing phosphotransfer) domain-containing protein
VFFYYLYPNNPVNYTQNNFSQKKCIFDTTYRAPMSELEISDQNFDLTFLLEIADGSNEFLVESIELFLKQTPELMLAINDAIHAKEWVTAAQSAHKLKPNLGFFGMIESQSLMQEIEAIAKTGQHNPEINVKFSELEAKMHPTLTKLEIVMKAKAAEL